MKSKNWRWIYGISVLLSMPLLTGCGGSISADDMSEDEVHEHRKQVQMTEQIRHDDLQRDEKVWTAARARDIGPLNELVRHHERKTVAAGSTPVVDIGPAEEVERHRQGGGCAHCANRTF